jgi:hypothetical protein
MEVGRPIMDNLPTWIIIANWTQLSVIGLSTLVIIGKLDPIIRIIGSSFSIITQVGRPITDNWVESSVLANNIR